MIQRKSASVVAHPAAATKLFVLDTNVLMHDPTSLFRFEEHDVYIPMAMLEELDNHKKGMSEVARNARQASRYLDEMIDARRSEHRRRHTARRPRRQRRRAGGSSCRPKRSRASCRRASPSGKADNQILGVVKHLQELTPSAQVILVSKDINMRIKAHARRARGRGLLQRQGAGGHRPPLHRHARAAGGLLGAPRQGDGVVAAGRRTPTTAYAARCARACS